MPTLIICFLFMSLSSLSSLIFFLSLSSLLIHFTFQFSLSCLSSLYFFYFDFAFSFLCYLFSCLFLFLIFPYFNFSFVLSLSLSICLIHRLPPTSLPALIHFPTSLPRVSTSCYSMQNAKPWISHFSCCSYLISAHPTDFSSAHGKEVLKDDQEKLLTGAVLRKTVAKPYPTMVQCNGFLCSLNLHTFLQTCVSGAHICDIVYMGAASQWVGSEVVSLVGRLGGGFVSCCRVHLECKEK